FERPVAQVLLTHDDLRNRRRYLNARATLLELLRLDAIPVVNENDTVSVDELKLGDNDNLAAFVAALVDADLLLIASDVPGLYTANPRDDPLARPVDEVAEVGESILAMAGGAGSVIGTGGMATKLQAAAKAAGAGIQTVLFDGTDADALRLMAHGTVRGTLVRASLSRTAARKRWLRHAPSAPGAVLVDAGAARALSEKGASLLPGGVVEVEGDFARGDIVDVRAAEGAGARPVARGIVQYSARDIRRIARRHSREIQAILGYTYDDAVVHRDDLVVL
ncbi:MAG: glutamate 5-kinase, partial [Lysobacteraceae bacterium]